MVRNSGILLFLTLIVVVAMVGCSDDAVTPAPGDGPPDGTVDPGAGAFEFTIETAGDPANPFPGPFVVRGRNVHYDENLGALVADLSVVNRSHHTYNEPVSLTFTKILPDGVEVLNADSGGTGVGAKIMFQFANDDAMWTPGEESFPRPVHFGVQRGHAVAFSARIGVGPEPDLGIIAGVVWHDRNENGERESDEEGIPGVEIFITRGDGPEITPNTPPEILYRALTDRSGRYAVRRLDPGFYVVTKSTTDRLKPTTPATIQVLLVEDNGQVSDFLDADFGCVRAESQPTLAVGDFVWVSGKYSLEINSIAASGILVGKCERDNLLEPPCPDHPSQLAGTVTDIDMAGHRLQLMGTWITMERDDGAIDNFRAGDLDLADVRIGDRVRARVRRMPSVTTNEMLLIGLDLFKWEHEHDILHGHVQDVHMLDGTLRGFVSLNTRVFVTALTGIEWPR